MMEKEFPLHWPAAQPRTKARARASFRRTIKEAAKHLTAQVAASGGSNLVISSNYGGLSGREPADPGVAVYFNRRGKRLGMGCDHWDRVQDNINALGNTVEAMRGIDRWGCSHLMEQAFAAFEALPPPNWRNVLGLVGSKPTVETIEARYKELAKRCHPDAGGDPEQFKAITAARDDARRELSA